MILNILDNAAKIFLAMQLNSPGQYFCMELETISVGITAMDGLLGLTLIPKEQEN